MTLFRVYKKTKIIDYNWRGVQDHDTQMIWQTMLQVDTVTVSFDFWLFF